MGSGSSKGKERYFITQVYKTWVAVEKTLEPPKTATKQQDSGLNPTPLQNTGWRTVMLYVCSTFKDFFNEREIIATEIGPALREWCASRELHLLICDLRWQIPKWSDSHSLLLVSLEEIDRCARLNGKPLLLSLASERVGWIPNIQEIPTTFSEKYQWIKGLSMTEMEIVHAAYRDKNPNALFMIREASFLETVPLQFRQNFLDGNPIALFKREGLKTKLEERFPVDQICRYSCAFFDVKPATNTVVFRKIEDFKRKVYDFFTTRIRQMYERNTEHVAAWDLGHLQLMHKSALAAACFGRDDMVKEIIRMLSAMDNQDNMIVLTGWHGSGKSHLLAKVAVGYDVLANSRALPIKGSAERWMTVYYSAQACQHANNSVYLLRNLLKCFGADEIQGACSELELTQILSGILSSPSTPPLVLFVDGADEVLTSNVELPWLPARCAPQVRCVLTLRTDSPHYSSLLSRKNFRPRTVAMSPLQMDAKKEVLRQLCEEGVFELTDRQVSALVSRPGVEPLWLRLALAELVACAEQKTSVDDRISTLPTDIMELYEESLSRVQANEAIGHLAVATLCLLACSSQGLLEQELRDLLADECLFPATHSLMATAENNQLEVDINNETAALIGNPSVSDNEGSSESNSISESSPTTLNSYEWAVLLHNLKWYLKPLGNPAECRWRFHHNTFEIAVRNKFLNHLQHQNTFGQRFWHQKLADYFAQSKIAYRRAEEYPYHLLCVEDYDTLKAALCSWDILNELYDAEYSHDLLSYWSQIPGDPVVMDSLYEDALGRLGLTPENSADTIAARYCQVILVLTQGGRYSCAERLLQRLLNLELDGLESQPEKLAEIHWLIAHVVDQMVTLENYIYASQLPRIKTIVHNYTKAIELYRLSDNPPKKKIAQILNRLAFNYAGWYMRGTKDDDNTIQAQVLAFQTVDECLLLYKSLDDELGMADAFITRGVCCVRAVPQQIKHYKQAEEIFLRLKGPGYHKLERLNVNIAIYFEELGEYQRAFDYFYKWLRLCKELFGAEHAKTVRALSTMSEAVYKTIAQQRGITFEAFKGSDSLTL